ncbi:MAG: hypothetical protein C4306_09775 [Thermoleophilia bacterium]
MSLTSELKTKTSRIRRFFERRLPNVAEIARSAQELGLPSCQKRTLLPVRRDGVLTNEQLTTIVRVVKRSTPYRRICGELSSRCPRDVWIDGPIAFVHFESDPARTGAPAWFVFAVGLGEQNLVAAKRLAPDERGEAIRVLELIAEDAQSTEEEA